MARRNLIEERQFQNVVIDNPVAGLAELAEFGEKIIEESQQAKIVENTSVVQNELAKMTREYQVQNQGDPFKNQANFEKQRQQLFDKYGEQISPFYKSKWNDTMRNMSRNNSANIEAWGYKQSRINTTNSINTAIQNSINQSFENGVSFGVEDDARLESVMNFAVAKKELQDFGVSYLGSTTTEELLTTFDEDNIKMFLGGVAESNPIKALSLMDKENVKTAFGDVKQYQEMKKALENKVFNIGKRNAQREVLDVMKNENSAVSKAFEEKISYPEFKQIIDSSGMSDAAKKLITKISGYSRDKSSKLSGLEKNDIKLEIYNKIQRFETETDVKALKALQDDIYSAYNNEAITKTEMQSMISDIVAPFNEKMYNTDNWYDKFLPDKWNFGYSDLEKDFEKMISISTKSSNEKTKKYLSAINKTNKVMLYDYYNSELKSQADSRGISISELDDLPLIEQNKIFSDAREKAILNFKSVQTPAIKSLPREVDFILPKSIPKKEKTTKKRLKFNPETGTFE